LLNLGDYALILFIRYVLSPFSGHRDQKIQSAPTFLFFLDKQPGLLGFLDVEERLAVDEPEKFLIVL